MEVIDERGRLFGAVNVVDALVLVGLAVVIAGGLVLVFGPDETAPEPDETRYATVGFSVPLESDAALLESGDTLRPIHGGDSLTVVDVYRSFTPNGSVHVTAQVEYSGTFTTHNGRVFGGDRLRYTTRGYRIDADVLGVDQNGTELSVRHQSVVVSSKAGPAVAGAIEPGVTASVDGDWIATVETAPARGSDRFYVGLTVAVWDAGEVPLFNGESLRVGNRLTVVTDSVVLRGRVAALGSNDAGRFNRSNGG